MKNEEKVKEILECEKCHLHKTHTICDNCFDKGLLLKMCQWKDEQLDSAIDKALQRNGDFLKQGKMTQYGYDIAFVTIQNIREYLKQ